MANKISASELKRIAAGYRACVTKCQQTADELRGFESCSAANTPSDGIDGFRIDVSALSQRELEVFALIGYGLTTKQIAKHVAVSASTIDTFRERLKRKLSFSTTTALMRAAVIWTLGLGGKPHP